MSTIARRAMVLPGLCVLLICSAAPAQETGPSFSPGKELTLAEALERADRHNPDLASAQLAVEKARAGVKKALGMILPAAVAKLEYTRMDHGDTLDMAESFAPLLDTLGIVLPPGTDMGDPLLINPQDKLSGAVQLHMPLIHPQGWATVAAAKKGVDAAQAGIEQGRQQILVATAQAYFMALSTRDLIRFYHSQEATAEEQLRIATARFDAGRGMRIDVIRARTDREQARQSLISAQLAFDNARDALGYLTGEEGLPMPVEGVSLRAPDRKARAADRRDVRAAREMVSLMDRQVRASVMQFVPELSAALQGSYQFTDMPDLGSADRSRLAFMLILSVPIYNHFRYGDLDEKRVMRREAELALRHTTDKGELAVRTARRDYDSALAAVETARIQAELAQEGLKLTESAYQAGTGDSLSVTNARQTHVAAGFNRTVSELKAQLALVSLLDALGRRISDSITPAP
jgi:outer membrane protein